MAIFETLSILFKADSTQLRKEVDDVNKKTKEATDNFKDVGEQTKKTDNDFINLSKTLAKVAATYFGAASTIGAFRTSISQTSGLAQFARETGVSIEVLDKWGRAVKNAGGNADAFHSSVVAFAKQINADPAAIYDYIASEGGLADQFRTLHLQNPTAARVRGAEYGFDPGAIAYVVQGGAAIRAQLARQEQLGLTTPEDAKFTDDFNRASGELDDALDSLKRAILKDALPHFTRLTEALIRLVQIFTFNKENLEGTPTWEDALFDPATQKFLEENSFLGAAFYDDATQKFLKENSFLYRRYFGDRKPNTPNDETQVPLPALEGGNPSSFNEIPYLPPAISSLSNSQAKNLHVGSINIHSNSSDSKAVANQTVAQLDRESKFLNSQFQQSNSYFDDAVVV